MSEDSMMLPVNVTSRTDVNRLIREMEALDDFFLQAAIRTRGTSMQIPKSSRLFEELVDINHLNMLRPEDRTRLKVFLDNVRKHAPVLHMSFSADPSPRFMRRLLAYLRREIHPLALVSTGLQPTIGAGCILRTTNYYFDFSLKQRFISKRAVLLAKLHSDDQAESHTIAGGLP